MSASAKIAEDQSTESRRCWTCMREVPCGYDDGELILWAERECKSRHSYWQYCPFNAGDVS